MKMNKLVRDRIPDIIREKGEEPVVTVLHGKGLLDALNSKFQEEYKEFLGATTQAGKLEELADILEVVLSTARHLGSSEEEVFRLCQKKRESRGSFDAGYYLVEVK